MTTYFSTWTTVGKAKLANAIALKKKLSFSQMVLGDGNGALPVPREDQVSLVRQVYAGPINQITIDPKNPSQIIAEMVVAAQDGGWWVREGGLIDADGDLCIVANCPPSYKPKIDEGSVKDQVVRIVSIVSNTAAVDLKIDPAVVLATRQYVDDSLGLHLKDIDPHPQYITKTDAQLRIENAVRALVNGAPGVLDTLQELAAALNNDAQFAATVTNALASKAPINSPNLTGSPTTTTPSWNDKTNRIANTEFVQGLFSTYSRGHVALFKASSTFVVPDGVYALNLSMCGGGGGGGGSGAAAGIGGFAASGGAGGGGAGQIHIRELVAVKPGDTLTITVGSGGNGGAGGTISTSSVNGSAGGTTSVSGPGFNYVASGGGGGNASAYTQGAYVGNGGASAPPTGSDGSPGIAPQGYGYAYGGMGGAGGSGPFGSGGGESSPTGTASGKAPYGFGAGGGGAAGVVSVDGGFKYGYSGFNGAPGIVIIEW